jgi:eukaryotic-like serine/threonine-protein kinase
MAARPPGTPTPLMGGDPADLDYDAPDETCDGWISPAAERPTGDTPGPPPSRDPSLPARIGPFRVTGVLGRGGMGIVYEAIDLEFQRRVAVKVLRPEVENDAGFVRRFAQEGRITGQLEHPAIVPVYRLGQTDAGRPYLVMRRLHGETLAERLDRDPPMSPALVRAMVTVARAVAYAHDRGVVHLDLKPSNLLLGGFGEVFVLDWGVAVLLDAVAGNAMAFGTPGYVDPRQREGPPDRACDVYSLGAILDRVATGLPDADDLDGGRGGARVPRELSELIGSALGPVRARPTAHELADALEDYLDGRRRRDEAARLVEEAQHLHLEARAEDSATASLRAEQAVLAATIDPWRPLADKRPLLEVRRALQARSIDAVQRFERMVATCERALERDPRHAAAREFLADRYLERLIAAEEEGDRLQAARWRARVEAFDDGRLADVLSGMGRLRIDTWPSGAQVSARRIDPGGLVWTEEDPLPLGFTPVDVPLPMGSWVLELRRPDRPPVRYPVLLRRGGLWEADRVWLPPADVVPDGFCYVPAGPFLRGGDPEPGTRPRERVQVGAFAVGALPVTVAEYLEYLDDLEARAPAEAFARCPRQDAGMDRLDGPRLLERTAGRWTLPAGWRGDHPVHSIDWDGARAYAEWRARRDGRAYRLPREDEWEKAARGVDGRLYPWGDGFDPSLCRMSQSEAGLPTIGAVGTHPTDRSVYGVRDVAGGMRCWCGDEAFDGDPERRPVRGGSFATGERVSRCPARYGSPPRHALPYQGIRLAMSVEPLGSG